MGLYLYPASRSSDVQHQQSHAAPPKIDDSRINP